MAFVDDVVTIQTATYGKEMRPAIASALMASWGAINAMMDNVNELNARVDSLPSGGGSSDPPDNPGGSTTGNNFSGIAYSSIDAIIFNTIVAGEAIPV